MPRDFDRCAKTGRVRTIPIKGHPSEYMHVCYDSNGKSHHSFIHSKNKSPHVPMKHQHRKK